MIENRILEASPKLQAGHSMKQMNITFFLIFYLELYVRNQPGINFVRFELGNVISWNESLIGSWLGQTKTKSFPSTKRNIFFGVRRNFFGTCRGGENLYIGKRQFGME